MSSYLPNHYLLVELIYINRKFDLACWLAIKVVPYFILLTRSRFWGSSLIRPTLFTTKVFKVQADDI